MGYTITDTQYYQAIANAIRQKKAETEKTLVSLALTSPPNITNCKNGDPFDFTGLVVTATYSDGTTANVTSECTMNYIGGFSPTSHILRKNEINYITYTYKSVSKTVSYPYTIYAHLQSIEVEHMPEKTVYTVGETLNFNDGTSSLANVIIRGYTSDTDFNGNVTSLCTFSPVNGTVVTTPGTLTIVATIDWYGTTVTTSFNLTVVAA